MRHVGTVPIETGRLTLRRFAVADAPAVFKNWFSDPEVTKFLTWPPYADVAEAEAKLAEWAAAYEREDYYQWAIVPKELGEPVGCISVVKQDDRKNLAHIGYCLGKAWWGRGYMTEALSAVIRFFFALGANRVETCHDTNNPASGRVMQKAGMIYEGTHRQAGYNNQGVCDDAYYGILSSDLAG